MSWEQILRDKDFTYPRSVSMPLQPIGSQYFMHVTPSFNVVARSVYPDVPELSVKSLELLKKKNIYELDFAFDPYAKIFDPNRSNFRRIDGVSPVIIGEYLGDGLKFIFTYYTTQTEKYVQDITTVKVKIINTNPKVESTGLMQPESDGYIPKAPFSKRATLYLKPQLIPSYSGTNDNYHPFRFNNRKWSYEDNIELVDNFIKFKDGNIIAKIIDTDMNFEIENKEYENVDELIKKERGHVHPSDMNIDRPYADQILEKLVNVLKFQKEILPGEECYVTFNLVSNRFDNSERTIEALKKTYNKEDVIATFDKAREGKATVKCQAMDIENIYKACQNAIFQLCVDFKEHDYLLPTQGGINDRFYCWIWEAMHMVVPMLSLGYKDIVKKSIDFMFTLQDSGVKPDGEFSDFDGAIGSTGPRWICTTGSAVNAAAKYLSFTKDKEFKAVYLPKMKKAIDWILRQTENTKTIENGKKVAWYGLLPRGTMNDGDYCYGIGFSDLYSFVGVRAFVETLKSINSPLYEEYKAKCDEYHNNIKEAFRKIAEPNGKIIKYVPSDKQSFYAAFENTAVYLFDTDIFDPYDEIMTKFAKYYEDNDACGVFLHNANEEESYMGTLDMAFQHYYLSTHQYKKAFVALMANMKYGMSCDTYQVQERYSKYDRFWCPWQPNGSGSGRMINMINKAIYFETDNEIILFGGLPPVYLKENKVTELKGLKTPKGFIDIKAEYKGDKIEVSISGDYDKNKKIVLQDKEFILK